MSICINHALDINNDEVNKNREIKITTKVTSIFKDGNNLLEDENSYCKLNPKLNNNNLKLNNVKLNKEEKVKFKENLIKSSNKIVNVPLKKENETKSPNKNAHKKKRIKFKNDLIEIVDVESYKQINKIIYQEVMEAVPSLDRKSCCWYPKTDCIIF